MKLREVSVEDWEAEEVFQRIQPAKRFDDGTTRHHNKRKVTLKKEKTDYSAMFETNGHK